MDHFMRMLQHRTTINEPDTSIKLPAGLVDQETLDTYSTPIRNLFFHMFNPDERRVNLFEVLPFQRRKTPMPVCNKMLQEYEQVYRCYDCSDHEAAVLCIACFEAGNHTGHRFKKISSGGGNCDCGNPLAIKKTGFCRNHSGEALIP